MDIIIRKLAPLIILTITILLSSCSDQNSTDVMNEINAVDATDAIDEMEGVDQMNEINEINELYLVKETTNARIYVKSSDDASTMIEILSAAFENHYERFYWVLRSSSYIKSGSNI